MSEPPISVLCVAGARPNFVKVAAILEALRGRGDAVSASLVHTGQHYDERLSKVMFEELSIPRPDRSLGVGGGSHAAQTAEIMRRFEPVLVEVPSFLGSVHRAQDGPTASRAAKTYSAPLRRSPCSSFRFSPQGSRTSCSRARSRSSSSRSRSIRS